MQEKHRLHNLPTLQKLPELQNNDDRCLANFSTEGKVVKYPEKEMLYLPDFP